MSTHSPVAAPVFGRATLPIPIRRAAVLGAGTMGSRIAAHLANAGIPTLLLDLPPKDESTECLAKAALDALAKPAAFYAPSSAALIATGNFEDDLPKLAGCDWVIEAVAEDLEIKTALLARVLPHLAPHALLTTNTSGLPIQQIAAGLAHHRERFFGTHFFNPPRYMRLLEVIPALETGRRGCFCRLRRPQPRQTGGLRTRHAQLHRQPHRNLGHVLGGRVDAGAKADG
jgi:3-hydroxyacyl-CoA dehydrogenase